MDKTVHWNSVLRKNQSDLLNSLPEEQREFMAFMLRTGNVSCHYYQREPDSEPTEDDYIDWLSGLPDNIAQSFRNDGFEKCKGVFPLRRHAAERNDIGMDAYMKGALSDDDYRRWSELQRNQ